MALPGSINQERRRMPRDGEARVAYVDAPGKPRCRCAVVNSSQGGALIDWGSDDIPLGPQVVLVLVHDRDRVAQTTRRRAVVLRRNGNRLGLKFLTGARA